MLADHCLHLQMPLDPSSRIQSSAEVHSRRRRSTSATSHSPVDGFAWPEAHSTDSDLVPRRDFNESGRP